MLNFLSLKHEAFGLDISDLSLKIAELKKDKGKFTLSSFGKTKIPHGLVEKGEIKDGKELAEVIKKAVKEVQGRQVKTKYLVVSLPEEKAFLDVISMPEISKQELSQAVTYQAENYIPLPLKDVYLDFQKIQPVYNPSKNLEVLIGAISRKIVDSYLVTLKSAGFQPRAFEVESLAVARALVRKERSLQLVLIIDFGQTRTSFIIFSGCSLRFTSTIPISSQQLTGVIAGNLKVSFKRAEELKLKYGLCGAKTYKLPAKKSEEQDRVFEAVIPILTDFAEQIKIHLDYYHSHASKDALRHDGKEMSKILLCGEGSLLKGFVDFLRSHLEMPIELGDPWVNIPFKKVPELPFEESLGYTTAIGLALRGVYGY